MFRDYFNEDMKISAKVEGKRYKNGLQATYEVRDIMAIGIGFKGKELKMIMR